jgi:hypothetical protein
MGFKSDVLLGTYLANTFETCWEHIKKLMRTQHTSTEDSKGHGLDK